MDSSAYHQPELESIERRGLARAMLRSKMCERSDEMMLA